MTNRKLTQGTAIPTLAATDKFYVVPAAGTVPWGYVTSQVMAGYISAGAGTALYPTGAFVTGGYLYFDGGTVLTDSSPITATSTTTLTNKRITPRRVAVTQSATPATNTDNIDIAYITGLAQAITSMTSSLTGTPVAGDEIDFEITDDGTARAITWGASFLGTTGTALPSTTILSKTLYVKFRYNGSVWVCLASVSSL